jgi:acyl-CoA synthetase (AMP-forming)/AMP-acid ligase II
MAQISQATSLGNAEFSTLVELLRWRAVNQADRLAFSFLLDGAAESVHLTYGQLDKRARATAAALQERRAAGERALLLYPAGLEYISAFFGCLFAGVTAVPVYPPTPGPSNRSLPRFLAIANNAQPKFALTASSGILRMTNQSISEVCDLPNLEQVVTDSIPEGMEDAWSEPAIDGDSLAFLQYTSGSTAAPKGIMLTHRNLLGNSEIIRSCFEHKPESQGVIWLPPYHDMGLIGGILQPIYAGFPCTLMSPLSFLQRPIRWLQAISDYRATTSGGPDFTYDLSVRRITPEQRKTLDLSSWDVAFNGAEPIRAETMERFTDAFKDCGFRAEAFYPCYGLAEATLIVSGGRKESSPVVRTFQDTCLTPPCEGSEGEAPQNNTRFIVGCGQAVRDTRIAIVDPETFRTLEPGQVGEIWVSGDSVAKGYWNQPEAREETFLGMTASGEGPFLRTGDLGFLVDGELFVTGRLKDLIIIAGRNLYPQDIERTVESCHPLLRPGSGAAFAVAGDGEERLVVVHEVERNYRGEDLKSVVQEIRRAVAESHDVRVSSVALLKPGRIPKTSSGKIEHYACRVAFLAGTLEVVEIP